MIPGHEKPGKVWSPRNVHDKTPFISLIWFQMRCKSKWEFNVFNTTALHTVKQSSFNDLDIIEFKHYCFPNALISNNDSLPSLNWLLVSGSPAKGHDVKFFLWPLAWAHHHISSELQQIWSDFHQTTIMIKQRWIPSPSSINQWVVTKNNQPHHICQPSILKPSPNITFDYGLCHSFITHHKIEHRKVAQIIRSEHLVSCCECLVLVLW